MAYKAVEQELNLLLTYVDGLHDDWKDIVQKDLAPPVEAVVNEPVMT